MSTSPRSHAPRHARTASTGGVRDAERGCLTGHLLTAGAAAHGRPFFREYMEVNMEDSPLNWIYRLVLSF